MRPEPQVVLIDTLLDQVEAGEVRVPQFQRPFEWRPDQMLELFDSIEKGYPIGNLLLWQTTERVPALARIGDIEVPTGDAERPVSYVLDGHQRLSTLFGVLRRHRDAPRSTDQRDWKWWIYRALGGGGGDRYRHHRGQDPAPASYLPLRAVSRTMDFLEFSRLLESRRDYRDRLAELIRQAEAVAHKIKNYQVSLTRLVGGSLDEAVEVYTRLNRTGMRMDPDQMVSALTYPASSRPSLAHQIDDITAGVAGTGFGVVSRTAIFRTVLAIAGEPDVMSPRWEAVAGRLATRLHDAVPNTDRAVRLATEFLQQEVRLPLAKFLPYAHQLLLLAVFFHHRPDPADEQRQELRRWFWVSSWTERFAGASYSLVRRSVEDMVEFAKDGGKLAVPAEPSRPVPGTFNLNSARTRAYVAWELQELPCRRDAAGNEFDPVTLLASADARVFWPVVPGDARPANRVVLPTHRGMSVRQALTEIWAEDRGAVLASHGMPPGPPGTGCARAMVRRSCRVGRTTWPGGCGGSPTSSGCRSRLTWPVARTTTRNSGRAWPGP